MSIINTVRCDRCNADAAPSQEYTRVHCSLARGDNAFTIAGKTSIWHLCPSCWDDFTNGFMKARQ